jgi:hypothetical protein
MKLIGVWPVDAKGLGEVWKCETVYQEAVYRTFFLNVSFASLALMLHVLKPLQLVLFCLIIRQCFLSTSATTR